VLVYLNECFVGSIAVPFSQKGNTFQQATSSIALWVLLIVCVDAIKSGPVASKAAAGLLLSSRRGGTWRVESRLALALLGPWSVIGYTPSPPHNQAAPLTYHHFERATAASADHRPWFEALSPSSLTLTSSSSRLRSYPAPPHTTDPSRPHQPRSREKR
jgi:hypothetical protein